MRAWYQRPPVAGGRRVPLVVYLHNDFTLLPSSYVNARPFLQAGYAVLWPSVRGENGNPGQTELLLGEVDDVKAAIAWGRRQPGIDPDCVYVIGHSIGGGLAGLLSLHGDVAGVRRTASVGGMYRAHTFHNWAERRDTLGLVRFDLGDRREIALRLLLPNLRDVVHPHIAYAGVDDAYDVRYAALVAERARQLHVPVTLVRVKGGHMSSVRGAVQHFLGVIRSDLVSCRGRRGGRTH
jgi:dienelactone hydrolase